MKMTVSFNFDLDRLLDARKFEVEHYKFKPRVQLVYGENEELLHLEVALGDCGGRHWYMIQRIRPDDFHFPRNVSGRMIDIHHFEFKFKCIKDAEVFWARYIESYDKAKSHDVATLAQTISSSFEINNPPDSDETDSDEITLGLGLGYCLVSKRPSFLTSDSDSDSEVSL